MELRSSVVDQLLNDNGTTNRMTALLKGLPVRHGGTCTDTKYVATQIIFYPHVAQRVQVSI